MNGTERMEKISNAIDAYERVARLNRPDWDAFLDEALRDTLSIAYEVEENSDLRFPDWDGSFDLLWQSVEEWLIEPRTAEPTRYFAPPRHETIRVYVPPWGGFVGISPNQYFSLSCDTLDEALKAACE